MASINFWMKCAKQRAPIILMDGRRGHLLHVKRYERSCKVLVDGRRYKCWVDDIALIYDERSTSPESYALAEPWPVLPIPPGESVRLLSDPPSRQWLEVRPDWSKIHPSFFPPDEANPACRST